MKKSTAVQDEFAKSQPSTGNALEAPVRLTPKELETVAAGFAAKFRAAVAARRPRFDCHDRPLSKRSSREHFSPEDVLNLAWKREMMFDLSSNVISDANSSQAAVRTA